MVCFKIYAPDPSFCGAGFCGREEDSPKQESKQATKALKKPPTLFYSLINHK